jgi:predicted nucleotidyltransferase component of viral defense system
MRSERPNETLFGGYGMTREIKNKVASIQAGLKSIAIAERREFNAIVLLYMQEKVLLRLSLSSYASNFVLKGGLLLFSLYGLKSRPTQDMDLLGRGVLNSEDNLKKVFSEVLQIANPDDCLSFEVDSISVEAITEDADYQGKRVKFYCNFGTIQRILKVDIGFSDVVVPKPQKIDFPVLLKDDPVPQLICYSHESVIAEKFEAMVKLSVLNSRMKDFYDVYILAINHSYDGRLLQHAIRETFFRRETPFDITPAVFTKEFKQDKSKITMWNYFLVRKLNNQDLAGLQFGDVIDIIEKFLNPIWENMINEGVFIGYWNPNTQVWSKK